MIALLRLSKNFHSEVKGSGFTGCGKGKYSEYMPKK
jgi:hypothetical protein